MPRLVKKDENLQPGKPLKSANLFPLAAVEWDRLTGELERSGIQARNAGAAHSAARGCGSELGRCSQRIGRDRKSLLAILLARTVSESTYY